MFRIRHIHDDDLPVNRQAITEVQAIFADRFPGARRADIEGLVERLRNPFRLQFSTALYVAENARLKVLGFALVLHDPELRFAFLDYIAAARSVRSRGVGAALYERVRDEAHALRARGLFFECLPDEGDCPPELVPENRSRLRFYEQYGVRPILDTAYETPIKPEDRCNPFLMWDGLDRGQPLRAAWARRVVRAILERRYTRLCPPEYVDKVVRSFREDPVRIRPPRYPARPREPGPTRLDARERIAVVVTDRHDIHHIRERGYVEAPARIPAILAELERVGYTDAVPVRTFPESHIRAVHDPGLVDYLKRACAQAPPGRSIYPYVFPVRNANRPPRDLALRAGYWCIDTFTPINRDAFAAARRAVDCALTAADEILRGRRIAYALVRPPGHHAERRCFGGFCYFNSAAVAAHYLSQHGRVAMVDVDYHHGNGQQDIFWERRDVLTVSLHRHPRFAYPFFSGFADEKGAGDGKGFNLNLPLPEAVDGEAYRKALGRAIDAVRAFSPAVLIVALGFDTARGDPTGSWTLGARDFEANGALLGALRRPTLIVQEGGYRTRTLGVNARAFLQGLAVAAAGRP
jgi:acetoin utilization deacetylase AcuC-like enzyme